MPVKPLLWTLAAEGVVFLVKTCAVWFALVVGDVDVSFYEALAATVALVLLQVRVRLQFVPSNEDIESMLEELQRNHPQSGTYL